MIPGTNYIEFCIPVVIIHFISLNLFLRLLQKQKKYIVLK
jgi:hypothetical protein